MTLKNPFPGMNPFFEQQWRDAHTQLITVLELLSPSYKLESEDRERYRQKRQALINARINVVEIDLVRQGASVFPRLGKAAGHGHTHVTRLPLADRPSPCGTR